MVLGMPETLSIQWLPGGRTTHTTAFASSVTMIKTHLLKRRKKHWMDAPPAR
jgi:hypothetical protein